MDPLPLPSQTQSAAEYMKGRKDPRPRVNPHQCPVELERRKIALQTRLDSTNYKLEIHVDSGLFGDSITAADVTHFVLSDREERAVTWRPKTHRRCDFVRFLLSLGLKTVFDRDCAGLPERVQGFATVDEVVALGGPGHLESANPVRKYRTDVGKLAGRDHNTSFFDIKEDPLLLEPASMIRHRPGWTGVPELYWLVGRIEVILTDDAKSKKTPKQLKWPISPSSRPRFLMSDHFGQLTRQIFDTAWSGLGTIEDISRMVDRHFAPESCIRNIGLIGSEFHGREAFVQVVKVFHSALTPVCWEIEKTELVSAERDIVTMRFEWRDKRRHERVGLLGAKPRTAKVIVGKGVSKLRFRGDQLIWGEEQYGSGNDLIIELGASTPEVNPFFLTGNARESA